MFAALYLACVLVFLVGVAGFYRPGVGFTSMVRFGKARESRVIPELRAVPRFIVGGSGYDGQFYAQLAANPAPWKAEVRAALDNPPYRSGRIVTSLVAYVLGGGNPAYAVHVYAAMNIVVWLTLAWLLLHFFPPGTPWDFACWAGILFSAGTMMSVCRALPDLSAFALMVAGLRLWETARPTAAAGVFGLAGLVRETSILAAAIVAEKPSTRQAVLRMAGRIALIAAPALALTLVLRHIAGKSHAAADNFALPFVAFVRRWILIGKDGVLRSAGVVATMLSIAVQVGFFASRMRLADARFRLGAVYAVLFAFTSDAIWEGYPGSAPRVLLPLLFAFNLALPRTPRFAALLLLGNLSVVTGFHNLTHPPQSAETTMAAVR